MLHVILNKYLLLYIVQAACKQAACKLLFKQENNENERGKNSSQTINYRWVVSQTIARKIQEPYSKTRISTRKLEDLQWRKNLQPCIPSKVYDDNFQLLCLGNY